MAVFERANGINRYVATLSPSGSASLALSKSSNVTIELTGGGTISHTVSGTAVEVKSIAANESYQNQTRENTFTYTSGTTAVITIDEEG